MGFCIFLFSWMKSLMSCFVLLVSLNTKLIMQLLTRYTWCDFIYLKNAITKSKNFNFGNKYSNADQFRFREIPAYVYFNLYGDNWTLNSGNPVFPVKMCLGQQADTQTELRLNTWTSSLLQVYNSSNWSTKSRKLNLKTLTQTKNKFHWLLEILNCAKVWM